MICAISDSLKEKFLSKMVGDVLSMARSEQPFSTENYIKDTYKSIFDKTGDRAKAQTLVSFIPQNLVSIYAINKEAAKHLKSSFLEFDDLRAIFEDFDAVGTYLGIGQVAAQAKQQETIEANEASLKVQEEDPTAGASEETVMGIAEPTNKSAISVDFKAVGQSSLTAFNVVRPDSDPIVVASQNFIGKYHNAQKAGSSEYVGFRMQVVSSQEILSELSESEREFLAANPSYRGVKVVVVDQDNNFVRVDQEGNIAQEGVLAQYMLNKPEMVDGVLIRKNERPIAEVAKILNVDVKVAQEARQREYRILYNIRKTLEQDPNRKIYLNISTSAGYSVNMQYANPTSLSEINFKELGEEFIPFVDASTGKASFFVSFSTNALPIDRPSINDIIPAETLAKYLFDTSIPLETRKEVFERLVYAKDIKIRNTGIFYNGQAVTEETIASVLKSVRESASGVVSAIYRANVPLNTTATVDVPYYKNGEVKYNTYDAVDYIKKHFKTPAKLEQSTKPYFNLEISPSEQLSFQADLEAKPVTQQKPQVKLGVSELFESNPELATAIYEALGVEVVTENMEVIPDVVGKVIEVETVKNEFYKARITSIEKRSEDVILLKAKTAKGKEYSYLINLQGEAVGTKQHFEYINSPNLWKGVYTYNVTPQQKQEALRLYSEYLDTGKQDIEGFKTFIQQQGSVKLGVAESADKAKPLGLQLDLDAITANIANELKENIISKGLGATFNIEESADSSIDENIPKGKQNSCK